MGRREHRQHNRAGIRAFRLGGRGNRLDRGATGPWPDQHDAIPAITRRSAFIASAAAVSVLTDYPDYSEHVANADQIAATGAPLLALSNTLLKSGVQVIPASGLYNPSIMNTTQLCYEIWMQAQHGSGTTVPFIQLQLAWIDSSSSVGMETDVFYAPSATASPGWTSVAKGPTKGNQLDLLVTNLDASNPATVSIIVLQHSRVYTGEIFRGINASNTGKTVAGFTMPSLPADNGVLGVVSAATIAAGASTKWLMSPAAGKPVQLTGNIAGITPASVSLTAVAVPSSVYGGGAVLAAGPLTTTEILDTFIGTRSPFTVQVFNNATSGTLTVNFMAVAAG